jgi:predicted esterase
MVMNTIYLNEECKYDIIFGHSQGAILTAALLSLRDKLRFGPTSPSGFIFNGAAWPNPYSDSMQGLSGLAPEKSFKDKSPKMLFIMGKADDINPIDSATRVSNVFNDTGFDVTIVEHDGGHSVPYNNDADSLRAMGEIVDWIMKVL